MRDYQPSERQRGGNKAVIGFIIILLGIVILLKQIGILSLFHIRLTWPLILIAVGLFIGVRNRFSNNAPFILIAIGVFNLIPAFHFTIGDTEVYSRSLALPALLILIGLYIILRNRRKTDLDGSGLSPEPTIHADVLFGGRKEIITAKDFKGGRVTTTFGGAEINLLQADTLQEQVVLDLRVTFGGAELIVPSHWEVRNKIEPIFGSVEDKRPLRIPDPAEQRKLLILEGSCLFGGIEIKSF